MRDEFIIKRQGNDFVLYKGLLNEAHDLFGKDGFSILAEIEHYAFGENDEPLYALARAEIITPDGKFTEWGDATRGNVGQNIRPHLFRMALTRAKARALRDAVNVGMVTLEELADDAGEQPASQGSKPKKNGQSKTLSTEKRTKIADLVMDVQYEGGIGGFEKKALKGKKIADLSEEGADKLIATLEKRKAELEQEHEVNIDEVEGVTKGGAKT